MNDWLKKQQRKKIPYGFFKNALDSRKEVSLGGKEALLHVPYLWEQKGSTLSLLTPSPIRI